MSLINQALRKAQQERSGSQKREADSGQAPGSIPASSEKSMPTGLIVGLIAAVALLLGLVVGLSFVLLSDPKPAAQERAGTESAETPAKAPVEDASAPETEPIEQATRKAERPEFTRSPSPVDQLREAREAAEAKAQAEAATQSRQPDRVDWLTRSRISGVKISPEGSRLILNGKAYTEGEYVNYDLNLRVLIIEETRVLFIDDTGKKYLKRL